MSEGDMIFKSALHEITVCLSGAARLMMETQALKAGNHETGGVLIGKYGPTGHVATITEATIEPQDSRAGRTWFERGVQGLKGVLKRRWNDGQYYVGEWHSHPGCAPEPSCNDIHEMQAISRQVSYQCPKPIMIIIGTSADKTFSLSASVMDGGVLIRLFQSSQAT